MGSGQVRVPSLAVAVGTSSHNAALLWTSEVSSLDLLFLISGFPIFKKPMLHHFIYIFPSRKERYVMIAKFARHFAPYARCA